jgi:NADPH:quinone reductase-like Zn-dependent oxidoreductase
VREGWVRVKISHASLNRHDLFTLRGITAHPEGISFPMILGNDGVGTLDDGTPVVIYPVLGNDEWRDDETLDPHWNIFSEHCAAGGGVPQFSLRGENFVRDFLKAFNTADDRVV